MKNPFHIISSKRVSLPCTGLILTSLMVILTVISCSGKPGTAEAVDLGLPSGTLWASYNLGASRPSEYGDFFAWGELEAKSEYEWSTLKYCEYGGSDADVKFSKYVMDPEYGTVDGKTVLEPEDDAASVNWGDGWRIPTDDEWAELIAQCRWRWTRRGDIGGYKIIGKNRKSIFLPAAGHCFYGDTINQAGKLGIYSASTIFDGTDPYDTQSSTSKFEKRYCCMFSNPLFLSKPPIVGIFQRSSGFSVRPVKSSE